VREVLDVRWCDEHLPVREGSDDQRVDSSAFLSGTAEAGGDVNRRWCELFHRDAPVELNGEGRRKSSRRRGD
jgi:hypothetical protein